MVQLYNKKESSTSFSLQILRNFWDFFQNTHKQILLLLLDLYEILPLPSKQLQYFSYYIATAGLALPWENNNQLTF